MKHGSEYARRVKRLFQQLVRKSGRPAPVEPTDPLEQTIVGILSSCTTNTRARAVFRKLRQHTVDLNELRVTPPTELADMIGTGVPLARAKAQRIVDALNDVRRRQDRLDLSFLVQRGRREAREYLESLAGVDRPAAASVVLHSLGGHAIPVDDLTLYILRKDEFVDPSADAAEVQGFLERHVSAVDTRAFVELLGRHVASRGSRVPVAELDALLNPPADEPPEADREEAPAASASDRTSAAKKPSARRKREPPRSKRLRRGKSRASAAHRSSAAKSRVRRSKRSARKARRTTKRR